MIKSDSVLSGENMNTPLFRITCQKCNMSQDWRNQGNCIHCGQRLNNWSVAQQLQILKARADRKKQTDYG